MANLVKDLLKGLDDASTVNDEIPSNKALPLILKEYQSYRSSFDSTLPDIGGESTIDQFKTALSLLPANETLKILNIYTTAIEEVTDPVDGEYEEQKRNLTKLIVYGFFALAFVTIASVVFLSVFGKEIPSDKIFSTIITTVVEIFKVLTGL